MIEAEILREKFRDAAKALQKLLRQRLVILFHLALSLLLGVVSLHPEWLPRAVRSRFLPLLTIPLAVVALLAWWKHRRRSSPVEVARLLEAGDPALNGLALTAAELLVKPEPGFLERRVISQCTDAAATKDWKKILLGRREIYWGSRSLIAVTLLLLTSILVSSRSVWRHDHRPQTASSTARKPAAETAPAYAVNVSPGDVEIEKGTRLVVEATFADDAPAETALVLNEPDGAERDRLTMRPTVDEKVFGGMISRVDKDALYHVEFSGGRSVEHRITTFVHPALERVDVRITPPAYTRLPPREIRNTMKVSAHEGSTLEFTLKINKPVKDAELFGEDEAIVPLNPSPADPTLLTAVLKAEKSQKWRVHLVDEKERANKNPPWITVTVQSNQLAKIEVVFPKRDVQVSQIQELPVEARVWDDLGVTRSGASFSIAGQTREVIFKHPPTEPSKKQEVRELLALEGESTQPRQLVSYHFWAEDTGPQGEVRRAMSDMFFAEVRHFEDIFREGESPPGEPGKEPKGDTDELVELQKQIVNATWRIVRETSAGKTMEIAAPDAAIVHQSQGMALEQTKQAMEKAEDAQVKNALTEAWKSMKDALDPLEQAAEQKKRASLNQALAFEQSALEWLHQAQSREHRIMRSKSQKTASGKQKQMQNQLMNLELKQEEQRYEEEKQAGEEQTAEQQENLQVLNRLKELARRQEALAEKMKELQNQLTKAKTDEEKQELQNQLKRLEEEQQQLLGDIDDLQQRMEKPENAASMAEAKQQLEQTREQVNEAAEKLKQQKLAEAANSATRAQRELEKMQEDFKQKTARRFTEEMKQMRRQVREVAEKQRQISETLENQKTPDGPKDDTSASLDQMLKGGEVARQIQEQQEKVAGLLEEMKRVSEQAEGSNPLLHRRLYEAVREARTGGLEEHLDEARMQSRYGQRAEAQDAERKAGSLVEKLQEGVDKAAESVLGSETEALRMARAELDKLIDEAKEEGGKAAGEQAAAKEGSSPAQDGQTTSASQDKPASETASTGKNEDGKGTSGQENRTTSSTDKPASTGSSDKPLPGQPNPKESMAQGQAQGTGEASGNPSAGNRPRSTQQPAVDRSSQPGATGERSLGGAAGGSGGGDDGGTFFFDQGAETANNRPFTGDGYDRWADRLRNVEELLNQPELRNEAAKVLDNAREMKIHHDRNDLAPQADHLKLRILQPLVELRDRVMEELAKRDAKNPAVPIDRDPVPPAFRDLVKRYYQELGGGQ